MEILMSFGIPQTLKAEHDRLHDDLMAAIAKGNRTGEAARALAQRLHPHFRREEAFALPPLGLLASLSRGGEIPRDDERQALAMADRLSSELPLMLGEHQEIVAALRSLISTAQEESHGDVVEFAENLVLHAQTEEEVLYPAALLLGLYLKLKEQAGAGRTPSTPV